MVFVYILKSLKDSSIYVGMTMDISNRVEEHNTGKSKYTKGHIPWILIYNESYTDWKTARIREKYLKSTAGKNWLRKNNILT